MSLERYFDLKQEQAMREFAIKFREGRENGSDNIVRYDDADDKGR